MIRIDGMATDLDYRINMQDILPLEEGILPETNAENAEKLLRENGFQTVG